MQWRDRAKAATTRYGADIVGIEVATKKILKSSAFLVPAICRLITIF